MLTETLCSSSGGGYGGSGQGYAAGGGQDRYNGGGGGGNDYTPRRANPYAQQDDRTSNSYEMTSSNRPTQYGTPAQSYGSGGGAAGGDDLSAFYSEVRHLVLEGCGRWLVSCVYMPKQVGITCSSCNVTRLPDGRCPTFLLHHCNLKIMLTDTFIHL